MNVAWLPAAAFLPANKSAVQGGQLGRRGPPGLRRDCPARASTPRRPLGSSRVLAFRGHGARFVRYLRSLLKCATGRVES